MSRVWPSEGFPYAETRVTGNREAFQEHLGRTFFWTPTRPFSHVCQAAHKCHQRMYVL